MGVSVTKNFNLKTLELTDRQLMREVGLLARERIYSRTISGRDEDNQPFRPYSADYKATKQRELGKSSPVNLQLSGGMLNALTILAVTDDSVTLGFSR